MKYAGGEIRYGNIVVPTGPTNVEEFKKMCKRVTFYYDRKLNTKTEYIKIGKCPLETNQIENYSRTQKLIGFLKSKDIKTKYILNKISKIYNKIIIFYFHKEVYNALGQKFTKIDGSVPFKHRHKLISKFKESNKKEILFLNYKSCGEGLDIKADCCIFLEKTWSKNLDYQAYMRAYGFDDRKNSLDVFYVIYEDEAKILKTIQKQKHLESFFKN